MGVKWLDVWLSCCYGYCSFGCCCCCWCCCCCYGCGWCRRRRRRCCRHPNPRCFPRRPRERWQRITLEAEGRRVPAAAAWAPFAAISCSGRTSRVTRLRARPLSSIIAAPPVSFRLAVGIFVCYGQRGRRPRRRKKGKIRWRRALVFCTTLSVFPVDSVSREIRALTWPDERSRPTDEPRRTVSLPYNYRVVPFLKNII